MRNHYLEKQYTPSPYIDDEVFADNQREGDEAALEDWLKDKNSDGVYIKPSKMHTFYEAYSVWHKGVIVDDCLCLEDAADVCRELTREW
jgi:hypothetical protein